MIEHHPRNKAEVQTLLEKALLHMTSEQIQHWMLYQFQPEDMYCFYIEEQLVSVIQMESHAVCIQGKKVAVNQITMAATHPDYQQKGHFSTLLKACLEQASYTTFFTFCTTNFPLLFLHHGFERISTSKRVQIQAKDLSQKVYGTILHSNKDTYELYQKFLSYFEASILYTKEEWEQKLAYATANRYQALTIKENDELRAFFLYQIKDHRAYVETCIYLDSLALLDGLNYLAQQSETILCTIGQDERIEKIVPIHYPRQKDSILVHCNDSKSFKRCFATKKTNMTEFFDALNPIWNNI